MKTPSPKPGAAPGCLTALCFCLCLSAAAQNVVVNPGFEAGTSGWENFGGSQIEISSPGHTGANALCVTNRTETYQGLGQSLLNLLPNHSIYFGSVWVRTSSPTNVPVVFGVEQVDASGNNYLTIASGQVSNAWTQLAGTFPYDANGAPSEVMLYVASVPPGVDFYVDDVALAPFNTVALENLLTNPNCEAGTNGWEARGAATLYESAGAHTGTNCLVAANRATTGDGLGQNVNGALSAGQSYFLSAWVRSDQPAGDVATLNVEQDGSTGTNVITVATGPVSNNAWTWLSGYYTLPANSALTSLKLFVAGPAAGTQLWLDDAYLAPVTGWRKAARNYPGLRLGAALGPADINQGYAFWEAFAGNYQLSSPENDLKFANTQPASNEWTLANANLDLDFGQAHGGSSRGHVFVASLVTVPGWIANASFTTNQLQSVLWNQINTLGTNYQNRLPYWDIVNEAMTAQGVLRTNLWYDRPGIGYPTNNNPAYIAACFNRASSNLPNTLLSYNDSAAEEVNDQSTADFKMLTNFVAQGVPVGAMGFENHLGTDGLNYASFGTNLLRFQQAGINLEITEMDVRLPVNSNGYASAANLNTQGDIYFQVLGTALGYPHLKVYQTWGLYDGGSWIPATYPGYGQALPFDFNFDKKPAYWGVWNALAGQAENFPVLGLTPGDSTSLITNSVLSAGAGLQFAAGATNDYLTVQAEVPFAGQWDVKVGVLETNSGGQFQLAAAPVGSASFATIGGVQDTYAPVPVAAYFDLGTHTFNTAGDWQFQFTVPSRNASSSGYTLVLDYLRLTPVNCQPRFTLPLTNQSAMVNGAVNTSLFMAEDAVACGSLSVTATSSNPGLIPATNVVITGSSPYYTLAATPLTNQTGSAVISLVANNGAASVTNSFTVTVYPAPSTLPAPAVEYTFDNDSGNTYAADSGSAPQTNADYYADQNPPVTPSTISLTNNTPDGAGYALNLLGADGAVNNYLACGNPAKLNNFSNFTLTAWVNLQGNAAGRILGKAGSGAASGFDWILASTNAAAETLQLYCNGQNVTSTATVNASNTWAFVAVSYNAALTATNVNFYSGGVQTAVTPLGGPVSLDAGALTNTSSVFRVGSTSGTTGNRTPPAFVDDVRVYTNAVLAASDLEAVRQASLALVSTPPPPGLGTRINDGILTLSWPVNYAGWILQEQTNGLNATNPWVDLPGSGSLTSTNIPVNPSWPPTFFRLRQP